MISEHNATDPGFKNIRAKFESEIAPVAWEDLQRLFARGRTIFVDPELSLVDVAVEMAEDNTDLVQTWMSNQKISAVTDQQAKEWYERNADLLTAVVTPWVLIQTLPEH